MRDLDALLNSLVNVDRASLVAILSSEAEAAQRLVNSARQRTASQRAKRHAAVERAARIEHILSFFKHGNVRGRCPRPTSCSANPLTKDCVRAVSGNRACTSHSIQHITSV
jgi:hypothetical protein